MKHSLDTRGEKTFRSFALVIMILWTLCAFLPLLLIFLASITEESTLLHNGYSFFPAVFSGDAYIYMIRQAYTIVRAYGVSVTVTVVGTALSLLITSMLGYVLSRPDFRRRNLVTFVVYFTMIFNGGIVPAYIMWTRLFHINNTIFALILPNYLMNAMNVLLVRNYYVNNIPISILESAELDGASDMRIFFRIMLPLAVPVSVTVGLFTGLAYWNDWINALYYIDDPALYGIQNLLIRMMNNISYMASSQGAQLTNGLYIQLPSNGLRMAMAVIGVLPVLVVFPFLQKYLIKGIVVGAVKG